MSLDLFKSHLDAFGRSIRLSGLEPDEEGYVAIGFDDLIVHLQLEAGSDRLVAFARLGTIEDERRETILAVLLGANLFWQGTQGATLAVEPDSDMVFIQTNAVLRGLDEPGFETWLGDFLDIADHWTRRLAALNAGEPVDEDEAPPPAGDERAIQFFA
jgi:hypothetical protein